MVAGDYLNDLTCCLQSCIEVMLRIPTTTMHADKETDKSEEQEKGEQTQCCL